MKEIALLKTLFDDGERKEYTRAVANNEFPPGKWSRVLVQELPKRVSRGAGRLWREKLGIRAPAATAGAREHYDIILACQKGTKKGLGSGHYPKPL
jgi:hypothetical protein